MAGGRFSSDILRKRLARLKWTSHNIRLSDEVTTVPGTPELSASDLRLRAILRVLDMLFGGRLAGKRIADLGALEGGYALALAERGAHVLGIEARSSNFEKLSLIREHFDLPNLAFLQEDIKNFRLETYGRFDVVLALGVLYHLDQPAQWLEQIAPTTDVLILDTNYAPTEDADTAKIDPSLGQFGPLERVDWSGWSYEGRWTPEFPDGTDPEGLLWAAFSNTRSFWLTKESLLWALRRAGFGLLIEQHDANLDHYQVFQVACPRAMFVALKSSDAPPAG